MPWNDLDDLTPQALNSRSGLVFNVKDPAFGAIGDGAIDDTTAIQAALDAAAVTISVPAPAIGGGAKVVLPRGAYGITSQLSVLTQVQLVGMGRSTEIRALSSFPTNTPLIRLGDGTSIAFNCRLENLTVNCDGISGSTAVYTTDIQEQSGLYNVLCRAYGVTGIEIDPDSGQGTSNWVIKNCEFLTNTGSGTNRGIFLHGDQSFKCVIEDVTINATGTIGDAGILITTSAGLNMIMIQNAHFENYADGIRVESSVQGVIIINVDSLDCTDLVETASSGRLIVMNARREGGTNTINDTDDSITITDSLFPLYIKGSNTRFVDGITSDSALLMGNDILIQFGGTTSSFPAIRNVGAQLRARLADGSANANFESAGLVATSVLITQTITTLANDATPSVSAGNLFITGGTTTITDLDDGVVGQTIKILSEHAITITDGTNILLNGSTDFVMASGDVLVLTMYNDQVWVEDSRQVN